MGKRLYLSESDKKISGVCGGIGEYFDIDSTLVRLGWVVLTVFSAGIGGLLVYIVASIIIPKQQQNI